MYFLRYQPLKDKLRARSMSDREALPYLIIFSGLAAAVYLFPTTLDYNLWDWIGGGLGIFLGIFGVIYSYVRNGGRQGFDLIQKYVVIGWVVTVRCGLGFIPCAVAFYYATETFGLSIDKTSWLDTLFYGGFEVILYQRIGRHIADTVVPPVSVDASLDNPATK